MTTETITIKLVHSVGGLMAEVTGLPAFTGPEYQRRALQQEAAVEALKAQYPQLVVTKWECVDSQTFHLYVERYSWECHKCHEENILFPGCGWT